MEFLRTRRAGALLHWTAAVLLVGQLAASDPGMRAAAVWLFAAVAALWVARTVLAGPMARPGTALTGLAATAHLAVHRGMLALVALTALAGLVAPGAMHARLLWLTLAAAGVHVAFNLWREATSGGVLRRMAP